MNSLALPLLTLPTRTSASFVALDFETANHQRDSACEVGAVRVERGRIVERLEARIRPPSSWFSFTHIHGISWRDVQNEPTFDQILPRLHKLMRGIEFIAAHNAPFDRSVLKAACERWGQQPPPLPFLCTVKLARHRWGIYPTRLPNVTERLGITLTHHNALSDAEACAQIVLHASGREN